MFKHRQINYKFYVWILLLITAELKAASSSSDLKKEGEKFGREQVVQGLELIQSQSFNDLMSPDQKGKGFDADDAYRRVKDSSIPANDTYLFLEDEQLLENSRSNRLDPDEGFIKRADEIVELAKKGMIELEDGSTEYTIEKCLEEDQPFQIEIKQQLNVTVKHVPQVMKNCKICMGHKSKEKHFWKSDAEQEAKKREKTFASDPSVKTYRVKIKGGGAFSDYTVRCEWLHHDDIATCDSFTTQEKMVTPERWEEEDEWVVENSEEQKLASSPHCTFIKVDCLEPNAVKTVEGRAVLRKCWNKIMKYICRSEHKQCDFLRSKNCIQTNKKCIKNMGNDCILWELTFKCHSLCKKKRQLLQEENLYGADNTAWEISYVPNTSFSEAVTKLKLFEEMKHQLEDSQYADITRVQLFKGKKMQCSKSVVEDLMYDCCFSFKGLTNQLKLSKCTADEIALAEMRENSLCYYLGSYDEKFLEMWTSRKEHVFCCFSSKLSRVLQEEGRKQLGINWGTPKNPDCRGLTQEEMLRLDFSKLDLSEAYEAMPISTDINSKIEALETRLKQRIEEFAK